MAFYGNPQLKERVLEMASKNTQLKISAIEKIDSSSTTNEQSNNTEQTQNKQTSKK